MAEHTAAGTDQPQDNKPVTQSDGSPSAETNHVAAETFGHQPIINLAETVPQSERAKLITAIEWMLTQPDAFPTLKPAELLPQLPKQSETKDESQLWAQELAAQLEVADHYKTAGLPATVRLQMIETLTRVDREQQPLLIDFGTIACGNWQDAEAKLTLTDYSIIRNILAIANIIETYQQKGFAVPISIQLTLADLSDPVAITRPEKTTAFVAQFRQLVQTMTAQIGINSESLQISIKTESEQLSTRQIEQVSWQEKILAAKQAIRQFWDDSEKVYEQQLTAIAVDRTSYLEANGLKPDDNQTPLTWETILASPWNAAGLDESTIVGLDFEYQTHQFLTFLTNTYLSKLPSWEDFPAKKIAGILSPRFKKELLQKMALAQHENLHKPSYESLRQRADLTEAAQLWLARQVVMAELATQPDQPNQNPQNRIAYSFSKPLPDQPVNCIAIKPLGGITQLDLPAWEHITEICTTADAALSPPTETVEVSSVINSKKKSKFVTTSGQIGLSLQLQRPGKTGAAHSATLDSDKAPTTHLTIRIYDQTATSVSEITRHTMKPKS